MVVVASRAALLHAERKARGECIYDRRDQGGPAHGKPVSGGRCQVCLDARRASEKRRKDPTAVDRRGVIGAARAAEARRRREEALERFKASQAANPDLREAKG
jgi:hypothetical protein